MAEQRCACMVHAGRWHRLGDGGVLMLPLRYPWLWAVPGWLLVLGVVLGSLMPDTVVRGPPFSDKLVHATSYALLMAWFAGLYARSRHGWVALVVLTLGLALEIVQSRLAYRTFDPLDLLANAFGVLAGFVVSFWFLAGWCQRLELRLASIARASSGVRGAPRKAPASETNDAD